MRIRLPMVLFGMARLSHFVPAKRLSRQSSAPKVGAEDVKVYAKDIGLDVDSFNRCFSSGKYKGIVQKDLMEGAQLGLNGTPAFFINGREISGAQPLERFAAIIDQELASSKK